MFEYLADVRQTQRAQQVIDRYAKAFPSGRSVSDAGPSAVLAPDEALKLYEQSFRPVLPANVVAQYFRLLKRLGICGRFLRAQRQQPRQIRMT